MWCTVVVNQSCAVLPGIAHNVSLQGSPCHERMVVEQRELGLHDPQFLLVVGFLDIAL
jgi:hypothetical protein